MRLSTDPPVAVPAEARAPLARAQSYERVLPAHRWRAIALMAVLLTGSALGIWELQMRGLGLHTADTDDGYSYWAVERRRLDTVSPSSVVIIGDSRILLDSDLDEWQRVSGIRPIQLAIVGNSALPFLRDLADDERFTGLVVVGISELLYFVGNADSVPPVMKFARDESPSQRVGHALHLQLQQGLAFMDAMHTPFTMLESVPMQERPGVAKLGLGIGYGKLSESYAGRQTLMWPPLESDPKLQKIARDVWTSVPFYHAPPAMIGAMPDFLFQRAIAESQRDVERIRSRGGEVVYVVPPYAGTLLEVGKRLTPRDKGWEPLLRATGSYGIHFEDYPEMQGLRLAEWSHLDRASAQKFTRIYVGALCRNVAWLQRRASSCN